MENGSYPQKIEFAIDSDIAIGTKIKITNGATNILHLEGDIDIKSIESGAIESFIYSSGGWNRI